MQNANNEAKRLIRIQAGLSDLNALDSASFSCSLFFFREIQQTNKQNPQTFATLETSCTKPYRPRVSGRRLATDKTTDVGSSNALKQRLKFERATDSRFCVEGPLLAEADTGASDFAVGF